MFGEAETDEFIAVLDGIAPKEYKKLFENIAKSDKQEYVIKEFFEPKCKEIIKSEVDFCFLPTNVFQTSFPYLFLHNIMRKII